MSALLKAFRVLAAVVAATTTTGICQEPHDPARSAGRGDVHSPGWKKVEELKGPPLSPRFPRVGEEIRREVLQNGLVVYLREDSRLPLFRAELIVKAGSYHEAAGELELASFTASQLREGGTEKMEPLALSERLAFLAASLGASAGEETSTVSLDILSQHLEEGLTLFADVVLRPAFAADRLDLARRSRLFALRHRNDSPARVLSRELDKLLYTAEHPRGRETRPEDVLAIDREDLVKFHRRFFSPDRAYLAVVGDFKAGEMLARIQTLFGGWKKSGEPSSSLPAAKPVPRPGIYVVDRDLNQSNLAIGHWGTDRSNPDRFAINLMNSVLGGGSFSSRITERVRSDEGLAYSARSQYATSDREVGLFQASAQTRTGTTVKAIRSIVEEIGKMRTSGISENEFRTAKESLLHSYLFRFEDPVENVIRLLRLEIEGLPADYYEAEFRGYQSVERADLERAAAKYLRPGELTLFVVGKLSAFQAELTKLGEVHPIALQEFTIPRGN